MIKPKWYTPRLSRKIVFRLYHKAKAERIPMTVLANRLIEQALGPDESSQTATANNSNPGQNAE